MEHQECTLEYMIKQILIVKCLNPRGFVKRFANVLKLTSQKLSGKTIKFFSGLFHSEMEKALGALGLKMGKSIN